MKSVFTCGCFDIIHPGHIQYLKEAKKLGYLIVSITSDKQFIREKKRKPVFTQQQRKEIIESISYVDKVIISENHLKKIIELKPDIYVKGGDYNMNTINQQEKKYVESYGGKIMIIPLKYKIHASDLK